MRTGPLFPELAKTVFKVSVSEFERGTATTLDNVSQATIAEVYLYALAGTSSV